MNNPLVNKILMVIDAIVLAFFTLRFSVYLLNILMPFVIGFIIASIANPLVKRLRDHVRLPRSLGSLVGVLIVLVVLGLLVYGIFSVSRGQVANLSSTLRDLGESAVGYAEQTYNALRERFPQVIQISWSEFVSGLSPRFESTIGDSTLFLGGWLFGVARRLPLTLLFVLISIISSYYISLEYDKVMAWIRRTLSRYPQTNRFVTNLRFSAIHGLKSWIKAQAIVMGIFSIMASFGFALIGYKQWLLMGILLAMFDALPIFGAGAVLWPLIGYHLLFGNIRMAMYHVILYLVMLFTRQMIEPKILGHQIGINPLVTLLVLYLGFNVGGIFGMIGGVIALVIIISVVNSRKAIIGEAPARQKNPK